MKRSTYTLAALALCIDLALLHTVFAQTGPADAQDALLSEQTAHQYLAQLRTQATDAVRQNSRQKESALVALAQAANAYAAIDSVPEAERTSLKKEALDNFMAAADVALAANLIRYSYNVATLALELNDRASLDKAFLRYLANVSDSKGRYAALNDYGSALAKLGDHDSADRYFIEAIGLRKDPESGFEARMRYAVHLNDTGKSRQALDILDQFDLSTRQTHPFMALFRQDLMHSLSVDTTEVDKEVATLREKLSRATGIGPLPKLTASKAQTRPQNVLGLAEAAAGTHSNPFDDSRSTGGWITLPPYSSGYGTQVAAYAVNAAEVIWNEARSESVIGQRAVAWGVRNRATINMHGCDAYPGAEGEGNTPTCRLFSLDGPQPEFSDTAKRWNCALHGGTTLPGQSHIQFKDDHVLLTDIAYAGMIDVAIMVINAFAADPTYGNFLPAPAVDWYWDPELYTYVYVTIPNVWDGNPGGAQEWRGAEGGNYCALRSYCKVRLGNVGGDYGSTPANPCPGSDPANYHDNFFWGRMP